MLRAVVSLVVAAVNMIHYREHIKSRQFGRTDFDDAGVIGIIGQTRFTSWFGCVRIV